MANSSDSGTRHTTSSDYTPPANYDNDNEIVVSALFGDTGAAYAAIRELRDIGVPAGSISMISRDEDNSAPGGLQGAAGGLREEVQQEELTYRASSELPNDEDLPTTEAEMTGRDLPIVTDWEVPPDEPLGGSDRLGLPRKGGIVRRNEVASNANEEIYTDFPDRPGMHAVGANPDSPTAESVAGDVQESTAGRTHVASHAVAGASIGAIAGLLAGLAGFAIPGIGPFIAAGPLAGVLSGIITGGAAGGIIGALSGIGVPDEYAREYAAGIEQGQTLVSVRTDSLSRDHVERVLTANGGEKVR